MKQTKKQPEKEKLTREDALIAWEWLKDKAVEAYNLQLQIDSLQEKLKTLRDEIDPYCALLPVDKKEGTKATWEFKRDGITIERTHKEGPRKVKKEKIVEVTKDLIEKFGEEAAKYFKVSVKGLEQVVAGAEIEDFVTYGEPSDVLKIEVTLEARKEWQKQQDADIPF